MAKRQSDVNSPAQPGSDRDNSADTNEERLRGLGDESNAASEEDDELDDAEDAEEEEDEGEGSF